MCKSRSLSHGVVHDEAQKVRSDTMPQARNNRRRRRWITLRIVSDRERRRWPRIVRGGRRVDVGQAPRVILCGITVSFVVLLLCGAGGAEEQRPYGFGRPANETEIQAWDIDVAPNGAGLPPGRGTVAQGSTVYAGKCAACHGATGTEGPQNQLVGGRGSLATDQPVKTIGSYWPYATTLYDYIFRAMPITAPQSLTPDEVYALVAWLLHQNGIIPFDAVMDATTLPAVQMPNRHGFVPDPRPDVPGR